MIVAHLTHEGVSTSVDHMVSVGQVLPCLCIDGKTVCTE